MQPIEEMLKELVQAEKDGERTIQMMPIFEMYEQTDNIMFFQKARDYIYFGDYDKITE